MLAICLTDLNELVRCDVTTRNARRARAISNRIDELETRIAELAEKEELNALRAPIDGNDVMTYLNLEPSRQVGDIMDMLLERRIEDGPYTQTRPTPCSMSGEPNISRADAARPGSPGAWSPGAPRSHSPNRAPG